MNIFSQQEQKSKDFSLKTKNLLHQSDSLLSDERKNKSINV